MRLSSDRVFVGRVFLLCERVTAFDLSAGGESRARKGGLSIAKQLEEVAKDEERIRGCARRCERP